MEFVRDSFERIYFVYLQPPLIVIFPSSIVPTSLALSKFQVYDKSVMSSKVKNYFKVAVIFVSKLLVIF